MRRANTVATLIRGSPAELMRSKIGAANGEEPEMDYHEGKGSTKSYEGYPKEFFTENLDYKGKIDLILKKKMMILRSLRRKERKRELNYIPYNKDLQFVCEPGDFEVMVGTDSRNVQRQTFSLK